MWKSIILDVECIVCNKSLQKINHDPRDVTRKMGKIACRRSRTPNWSPEEKKYLLHLIRERKEVVITKNNNGPNYSEEKDVAWNEILRELALKFGTKFSGSSTKKVKTQWQNMKRIAREEIALIGTNIEKFTIQTLEVCNLLDMIKDGVLKRDEENLNETVVSTNVEIKTERLDEDMNEPSCSGTNTVKKLGTQSKSSTAVRAPPSESSMSDQVSDALEVDASEDQRLEAEPARKNVSAMTEDIEMGNFLNSSQRQLQEFLRYSSDEKQLKMESLKEERCIVRAMRETAELNKIIAEQKLKHVLWLKKQEIA